MTRPHLPPDSASRALSSLRASVTLLADAVELNRKPSLAGVLALMRLAERWLVRAVGEAG